MPAAKVVPVHGGNAAQAPQGGNFFRDVLAGHNPSRPTLPALGLIGQISGTNPEYFHFQWSGWFKF